MLIDNVGVYDLQKMLDKCVQPNSEAHGYLAYKKVTVEGKGEKIYLHTFSSKEKIEDAGYKKATVAEIHNITHYILSRNADKPAPNKILQSLHKISENRNKKLNSLAKKVGRFFLSLLKYILYATIIGIPFALMIRNKQSEWRGVQAQTNRFLQVTSSPDKEIHQLLKGWNSGKTRQHLQNIVPLNICDDLQEVLPEEIVKEIVASDGETPLVLDALRRDHSRGCSAKYILIDEETGFSQTIDPIGESEEENGAEHFKEVVRKIEAFNVQGDLAAYSSYVQALMCQNVLQALLYKQKAELQTGAWQTENTCKILTPGRNPCDTDLAEVKITVGKKNGNYKRKIYVEGSVNIHSELSSIRAVDAKGIGQVDFEEPTYHFTAKISFDLLPLDTDARTFQVRGLKVRTGVIDEKKTK